MNSDQHFSSFRNVICEKEPERRKEVYTYAGMIDSIFIQYGGTHFYDYHVALARKAEQYFHLIGTKLDSSLYMQTFAGLKSATCDLCSCASHNSKFCPISNSSNRFHLLVYLQTCNLSLDNLKTILKLINSVAHVYFTMGKKYAITFTLWQGVLSSI